MNAEEMDAKEILRRQIGMVLSKAGLNRVYSQQLLRRVENQVISLFQGYLRAPAQHKDAVYAELERKILRMLEEEGSVSASGQSNSGSWSL